MRRMWPLVLALALSTSAGCQLDRGGEDCVTDPGMVTGGTSLCTQPPPPQLSKLGQ